MQLEFTIDGDHLKEAKQEDTPNKGGKLLATRFIVIHYTAGPSLEGTVNTFKDPARQASAHLVVSPNGSIVQMVPFDQQAWHAGKSAWKPAKGQGSLLGLSGLNRYSIGIELVNAGPLSLTNKGTFLTWWGATVDPDEVVEVDPAAPSSFGRKWWHRYPEQQIWTCTTIVQTLKRHYPIEEILGHSDIAPGRKTDPGPVFPMQHLRAIADGRNQC